MSISFFRITQRSVIDTCQILTFFAQHLTQLISDSITSYRIVFNSCVSKCVRSAGWWWKNDWFFCLLEELLFHAECYHPFYQTFNREGGREREKAKERRGGSERKDKENEAFNRETPFIYLKHWMLISKRIRKFLIVPTTTKKSDEFSPSIHQMLNKQPKTPKRILRKYQITVQIHNMTTNANNSNQRTNHQHSLCLKCLKMMRCTLWELFCADFQFKLKIKHFCSAYHSHHCSIICF